MEGRVSPAIRVLDSSSISFSVFQCGAGLVYSLLLLSIAVTAALAIHQFREISVIHLGIAGLLAYSVPAILGLSFPPHHERQLVAVSPEATVAMALAWLGFALVIGLLPAPLRPRGREFSPASEHRVDDFLRGALVVSIALYGMVCVRLGALFFLRPRAEISPHLGLGYLFFKWALALGLIASVASRRSGFIVAFSLGMIVVAIAGDRTTPLITVLAVFLFVLEGFTVRQAVTSWRTWGAVALALGIVFGTKFLYGVLKFSDGSAMEGLPPYGFLLQWEAFLTHEILERVIRTGFSYSPWETLKGTLGQLLLLPSLFGIDSSRFNEVMQSELFPGITFNIAHNHWAQWFSMFGYLGVFLGAAILGGALVGIDRWISKTKGAWHFLALLVGSAVAVYVHRNSIENEAAIIRQIVLSFCLVWVASFALRKVLELRRA